MTTLRFTSWPARTARLIIAACAAATLSATLASTATASPPATDPFKRAEWVATHYTSLAQRIDLSYRAAVGRHPKEFESEYWTDYVQSGPESNKSPLLQYLHLVQWHKDFLGKNDGIPLRRATVKRSYRLEFHHGPSEAEILYWFTQPVFTCDELRKWHRDYIAAHGG